MELRKTRLRHTCRPKINGGRCDHLMRRSYTMEPPSFQTPRRPTHHAEAEGVEAAMEEVAGVDDREGVVQGQDQGDAQQRLVDVAAEALPIDIRCVWMTRQMEVVFEAHGRDQQRHST